MLTGTPLPQRQSADNKPVRGSDRSKLVRAAGLNLTEFLLKVTFWVSIISTALLLGYIGCSPDVTLATLL